MLLTPRSNIWLKLRGCIRKHGLCMWLAKCLLRTVAVPAPAWKQRSEYLCFPFKMRTACRGLNERSHDAACAMVTMIEKAILLDAAVNPDTCSHITGYGRQTQPWTVSVSGDMKLSSVLCRVKLRQPCMLTQHWSAGRSASVAMHAYPIVHRLQRIQPQLIQPCTDCSDLTAAHPTVH